MKNIDAVYPVKVWSRWLRISHWLMAVSALALIVSGWVLDYLETPDPLIRDYHYLFGHLLLASLILRGVLLFARIGDHLQTENWKALRWDRSKAPAMLDMLKYYMSLGRMPKPAYYAHSPLWLPFYPLVLVLLTVSALSGYLYDAPLTIAGFGLWRIHGGLASLLEIVLSLHMASAVIQDMSAPGGDISGMISGYRLFKVDKQAQAAVDDDVQLVSFDADAGRDYRP